MALPMLAYSRNLAFCWAVRELGMTATVVAVAGLFGITLFSGGQGVRTRRGACGCSEVQIDFI
jgi:hypothetical protein